MKDVYVHMAVRFHWPHRKRRRERGQKKGDDAVAGLWQKNTGENRGATRQFDARLHFSRINVTKKIPFPDRFFL
jgi:hypothetical protein